VEILLTEEDGIDQDILASVWQGVSYFRSSFYFFELESCFAVIG
jgi:hypothetical protein